MSYKRLLFLFLAISSASALGQGFTGSCIDKSGMRYDTGNKQDMIGNPIVDPSHGWSKESWGVDEITWRGGEELLLNNGVLSAKVVFVGEGFLRAVMVDPNNTYAIALDTVSGEVLILQQQTSSWGANRSMKMKALALQCTLTPLK